MLYVSIRPHEGSFRRTMQFPTLLGVRTNADAMRRVVPERLPRLDPASHDAAVRGAVVLTLSELGGVTHRLLAELERGERGVRMDTALDLLAGMGFDVVLVPRDPSLSLQAPGEQEVR